MLAPTLEARETLRERFRSADPFPHVLVDGFFETGLARELLEQFPAFDSRFAVDEFGRTGGKAVVSDLGSLGPAYRQVHANLGSQAFLDWLSDVTGIPSLLYDADNFGGGTHENIDGQGLLPHVDFNYHPATHFHRRLNLIVYLNEEWKPEWGGSIHLHADPRTPVHDRVRSYAPFFNRCVIFETSERSWHSFDRVALPHDEKHRTRKSLSVYFYTRERPDDTTYADHTTFYVPRPLPPEFQTGRTLDDGDMETLARMIAERDDLLAIHQQREAQREPATLQANRYRARVTELLAALRLPILGYVRQRGETKGYHDDGWAGASVEFAVEPECEVIACVLRGDVPQHIPPGNRIGLELDGILLASTDAVPGPIELQCAMPIPKGQTARLRIVASATVNLAALGVSSDVRDLGLRVDAIIFHHPPDRIEALRTSNTITTSLAPCPICREPAETFELGSVKPTHPGPFHVDTFRLLSCGYCESVYLDPRPTPDDLAVLYEPRGQFSSAVYTDELRVTAIVDYMTSVLQRIPKPASCLEIGAGLAWMSRACKALDPAIVTIAQDVSAEGADVSPWVDAYHVGRLETFPDDRRFDLISMTHVIEHLTDPLATLLQASTLLARGGHFFITGPYRPSGDRAAALASWERYSYLHVPAHITYLSERWFALFAVRAGLTVERWDASHEGGDAFEVILRRAI